MLLCLVLNPGFEQNYRSKKARLVYVVTFLMDFDGLGLCFSFGRCCLHTEFYSQNSTSTIDSVVLRSL